MDTDELREQIALVLEDFKDRINLANEVKSPYYEDIYVTKLLKLTQRIALEAREQAFAEEKFNQAVSKQEEAVEQAVEAAKPPTPEAPLKLIEKKEN